MASVKNETKSKAMAEAVEIADERDFHCALDYAYEAGYKAGALSAGTAAHRAGPELLRQLKAMVVQMDRSNWLVVPPGIRAAIAKAEEK